MGRDFHNCNRFPRHPVSIHAPTWGATFLKAPVNNGKKFQSTRPRGARHDSTLNSCTKRGFNPRAHVGRDQKTDAELEQDIEFQSTRPRGARPKRSFLHCSITGFNPRAHVGRDYAPLTGHGTSFSFNPRAHVGRDLRLHHPRVCKGVSIHAPTWGATL